MVHSGGGITRRDIRKTVAHMLNDYQEATEDIGGETGSLHDAIVFGRETGYFNGMQVFFSNPASPNFGHLATVTRSDGPTRTVNFEPPLASGVTQVGDTVEMYNFKGRGTTVGQYNASINDAITVARTYHHIIPTAETLVTAFNRATPTITVPDDFASVWGVSVVDGERPFQPRASDITINRFDRTISVRSRVADRFHGKYVTVYGYVSPPLLNDDDDTTSIDPEWLFNEVKAQILERMVASGMPIGAQDRLYIQERQEAGGKRPMIVTRAMPGTVRLL